MSNEEWTRLYTKLMYMQEEYKDIKEYTININKKKELEILLSKIKRLNNDISRRDTTICNIVDILEDDGWCNYE